MNNLIQMKSFVAFVGPKCTHFSKISSLTNKVLKLAYLIFRKCVDGGRADHDNMSTFDTFSTRTLTVWVADCLSENAVNVFSLNMDKSK